MAHWYREQNWNLENFNDWSSQGSRPRYKHNRKHNKFQKISGVKGGILKAKITALYVKKIGECTIGSRSSFNRPLSAGSLIFRAARLIKSAEKCRSQRGQVPLRTLAFSGIAFLVALLAPLVVITVFGPFLTALSLVPLNFQAWGQPVVNQPQLLQPGHNHLYTQMQQFKNPGKWRLLTK